MHVKKLLIGYVSGVHGLRGDLKIKSNFSKSDLALQKNKTIYLNNEEHVITNSKLYKGYYLVTIDNLKDINAVEHYKGYDVFIDRDSLQIDEYLIEDLPGLNIIYKDQKYGKVCSVTSNGVYSLLCISFKKDYMIPLVDEYIKKVDLSNNTIEVDNIEGLIL